MENKFADLVDEFLARAARNKRLSIGRLMSPEEVAESVRPGTPDDKRLKGWFLCGDVHPELFKRMKAGEAVTWMLNVRYGNSGTPFILVRQRVGTWEHRFLMPLVGESARAFYKEIAKEGIGVSLATAEGEEALVERVYVMSEAPSYKDIDIALTVGDESEIGLDFVEMTILLLSRSDLGSGPENACDVCLTAIMPADVRVQIESVAARKRGQMQ